MNDNYTHIVMLLDNSGSMLSCAADVIKNTNSFAATQTAERIALAGTVKGAVVDSEAIKCTFTIATFHNQPAVAGQATVINGKPINFRLLRNLVDVDTCPITLTGLDYSPRGGSPLLDALGDLIEYTSYSIEHMHPTNKPGRVIFVVFTDGEDTASCRYSKSTITDYVASKTANSNWQFIYINSEPGTFSETKAYGFNGNHNTQYGVTSNGLSDKFARLATTVLMKRIVGDPVSMRHCKYENMSSNYPAKPEDKGTQLQLTEQTRRADAVTCNNTPSVSCAAPRIQMGHNNHNSYDYTVPNRASYWPTATRRKADKAYFTEHVESKVQEVIDVEVIEPTGHS